MELPEALLESSIEEQNIYFFTEKAPIGIANHMHICLKVKDKLLLFSTCTSQTDTVYRLAQFKGWDLNTFPCFKQNKQNSFQQDLTYVNCNNIFQCEKKDFIKWLKNGVIKPLEGKMNETDMELIAKGVKKSSMVAQEIKDLFV